MPMRAHDHPFHSWSTVFFSLLFWFILIEMWCARKYQSIHYKYPYNLAKHRLFHSIPILAKQAAYKFQYSWKFQTDLNFFVSNRHSKFRYIRMLSYPMWPMRVCVRVCVRYEIKATNDGSTAAFTHIHTMHLRTVKWSLCSGAQISLYWYWSQAVAVWLSCHCCCYYSLLLFFLSLSLSTVCLLVNSHFNSYLCSVSSCGRQKTIKEITVCRSQLCLFDFVKFFASIEIQNADHIGIMWKIFRHTRHLQIDESQKGRNRKRW